MTARLLSPGLSVADMFTFALSFSVLAVIQRRAKHSTPPGSCYVTRSHRRIPNPNVENLQIKTCSDGALKEQAQVFFSSVEARAVLATLYTLPTRKVCL